MFIYRKKQKSCFEWHTSHRCSGWFPQDGLLGFWCGLWRHSRRSWRRKAITGTYTQPSIFQRKWRQRRWWRRQRWALVRQLSHNTGRLTVQVHLPVFNVIPNITVGTIAVVLHFFTKSYPFPCSRLRTPLFLRSVHQRLHGSFLQITVRYTACISIWDAVGPNRQGPISQQGTISLDRVGRRRQPRRLVALDRRQSRRRRGWIRLPQHSEDSRGVRGRLDEWCAAPHLDLLQAGSCCAAGAAVECVRFGTVCHLILQLQVRCQCVNLVNHLHNSQSENSEKSLPQWQHRKTKALSTINFVLPRTEASRFF